MTYQSILHKIFTYFIMIHLLNILKYDPISIVRHYIEILDDIEKAIVCQYEK